MGSRRCTVECLGVDSGNLVNGAYWPGTIHPTHRLAHGNREIYGLQGWEGKGKGLSANVALSRR